MAKLNGAKMWYRIHHLDGPIREARFNFESADKQSRDGGVHALFTITGRTDTTGYRIAQPDFTAALSRTM